MKRSTALILPFAMLSMAVSTVLAQPQTSLKDAYKDYFKVGVAVNFRNVTVPEQQAIVLREFNSVTAENDMKPERLLDRDADQQIVDLLQKEMEKIVAEDLPFIREVWSREKAISYFQGMNRVDKTRLLA